MSRVEFYIEANFAYGVLEELLNGTYDWCKENGIRPPVVAYIHHGVGGYEIEITFEFASNTDAAGFILGYDPPDCCKIGTNPPPNEVVKVDSASIKGAFGFLDNLIGFDNLPKGDE